MSNSLISVIMPIYNVAEYIERSVNSLLSQTYRNVEIILINDGSKDNSGEVCYRLVELHGDKIKLIEQENKGVSAARNAGLDIASGEYIAFVDADDWVSDDYLERLYTAIIENDADLATCGFVEWYSAEKQFKHIRPKPGGYSKQEYYDFMRLNQSPLCASIYKGEIIKENHIKFDTLLRRMEDGCFVADYCSYCDKFAAIPEYMYFYYQREGSAINQYHQSTILGVERTVYIIEKLENSYKRSGLGFGICEQQFVSKWANFIPRIATGITNRKNTLNAKEKREFLKESMRVSGIKERLTNLDVSSCAMIEKILVKWVKKEKLSLLLIYGRCYNALRKIKHILKGQK